MKLKIGNHNETMEAAYVVCVPAGSPSPFASTNVLGVCSLCSQPVQHRPYVPKDVPKACVPCYLQMHKPDDTVVVEPRAIVELLNLTRNN